MEVLAVIIQVTATGGGLLIFLQMQKMLVMETKSRVARNQAQVDHVVDHQMEESTMIDEFRCKNLKIAKDEVEDVAQVVGDEVMVRRTTIKTLIGRRATLSVE